MDIKAYYAEKSVRVFTMVDELKELSAKRLKALEILKEKNFYQIFDSFFEACDGFGFDAELEDSMSWNNRCYTQGEDFIKFFKKIQKLQIFQLMEVEIIKLVPTR